MPITRAPALLGEVDDALAALAAGDPDPLLRLPTPVRATIEDQLETQTITVVRSRVHWAAWDEFGDVPHPAMAQWIARAESWVGFTKADDAIVPQASLTEWLARAWRFDEAEEALAAIRARLGQSDPIVLTASAQMASAIWPPGALRARSRHSSRYSVNESAPLARTTRRRWIPAPALPARIGRRGEPSTRYD